MAWLRGFFLCLVLASVAGVSAISEPQRDETAGSKDFRFGLSNANGTVERKPVRGEPGYYQIFVEHNNKLNSFVLGPFLPASAIADLPHFMASWLRNYVAGTIVYFASGGLWCLWVYWWKKETFFPKGNIPGKEPILLQIWVTMKSMPLYTALPATAEFFVEKGWTRCYAQVEEVGWATWTMNLCTYMVFVEFFIYWMHRGLHDIKPLYKLLHATHHIYNKENTLSPFAGLAFNPIDGILQACPHVFALFFIPTHFFTHEILLFCEAVWTTNIHDCIHGDVFGIMGAGYHTIHHTTYKHNYGHYTIAMDWLLGTLRVPVIGQEKEVKTQ